MCEHQLRSIKWKTAAVLIWVTGTVVAILQAPPA